MTQASKMVESRDLFLNTEQVAKMSRHTPESYVDPDQAAAFLNTNRLKVIRMARSGSLPAHPLGGGKRRQWRFKLSELDKHMQGGLNGAHPPVRRSKGE
jgi:excisionase family DNA binding protein